MERLRCACERCNGCPVILTHGTLCQFCDRWHTPGGDMVRPDEPELGIQRRCGRCRDWFPLEEEFFRFHRDYFDRNCWACTGHPRVMRSPDGRKERRRETNRLASAAYRQRQRVA